MIADAIALIEFVLKRREKVEENRKKFLDNFVEPAYLQFQKVHQNYLESFQKYRDLIQNSQEPLDNNHKILTEIQQDSLNNEGIRQELANWYKIIYETKVYNSQDPVLAFTNAILSYLLLQTHVPREILFSPESNAIRRRAYHSLRRIFNGSEDQHNKILQSIKTLNGVQKEVQDSYAWVNLTYLKLKTYLLS